MAIDLKYRIIQIVIILSLFSFISENRLFHDFHTSLTEIRLNEETNSLEITIRVFTDDLHLALETFHKGEKINLREEESKILVEEYFNKHFAFIKDKELRFATFLGNEVELDATWLYFELNEANLLKNATLKNTIFLELFSDQNNLVNVILPQKTSTLLFNKEDKRKDIPL